MLIVILKRNDSVNFRSRKQKSPSDLTNITVLWFSALSDRISSFQAWSTSTTPPYFNITLYGCCYLWRIAFKKECQRRNLADECNEFESAIINAAHIKVVFIQDAELFRMWPIFDLPARETKSTTCYARFYRDF
uniref:Uncharacterized protein n=1 Tax=Angiostrongylus cantonensis TaxID=6313 RepID=A0A0K0D3F7_ANGCA